MAWSVPYTLLIVGLVAAPSVAARAVHLATGDPLWQYLAIDEERIATAETRIDTDVPHVRVRIFWRGAGAGYDTPEALVAALRASFEMKGIEPYIAVVPGGDGSGAAGTTTIDMRAGSNRFGPFPVADAPRHIQPAVEAAHLAFRPAATEEHRW